MAGSRHSKADMDMGRKARQAARDIDSLLVELGFDDTDDAPAPDEAAKALKAIRPALKAALSDDDYDRVLAVWSSAWTFERACAALASLSTLFQDATGSTLDTYAPVIAAMRSLLQFVSGKLDGLAGKVVTAPVDDMALKAFGGVVKSVGAYNLKGVGICYGGKDLYDDTFTATTDFGESRSFVGMPVYYDHALGSVKSQVGTVKAWEATEDGIVFEIELDRHKAYVDDILKLAQKGALGYSTGALAHTVVREAGELKRWIIGEVSLTPTPAEPRTLGVAAKSLPEVAAEASNRADTDAASAPLLRIRPT